MPGPNMSIVRRFHRIS